jgi:hypothetical protein
MLDETPTLFLSNASFSVRPTNAMQEEIENR